jgi:hypothetical protein
MHARRGLMICLLSLAVMLGSLTQATEPVAKTGRTDRNGASLPEGKSVPGDVAALCHVLALAGRTEEAEHQREELHRLARQRYVPPSLFSLCEVALGRLSQALDYLDRAYAEKDHYLVFLHIEPRLNPLRAEPRFIELLRRMPFHNVLRG